MGKGLLRSSTGELVLNRSAPVPVHLFYRFSGKTRHFRGIPPKMTRVVEEENVSSRDQIIPGLAVASVVTALQILSAPQRAAMSIFILLNGHAAEDPHYQLWFLQAFGPLHVKELSVVTDCPGSNEGSYECMLEHAAKTGDAKETMLLFLEEDYFLKHDAFTRSIDFWSSYQPCFIVPYDYPDRYSRTDNEDYGRTAILRMPQLHWRSVESTMVTYAVRRDIFDELRESLPAPWDDRSRSRRLSQYGIWSPIPSLASHVHQDEPTPWCGLLSDFDEPCKVTVARLCAALISLEFPLGIDCLQDIL